MQAENSLVSNIPTRLKSAIVAKKINQNTLAELTNISRVTISRYMSGTRLPGTEELYKMAKILDVSMEFILTGEKSDALDKWEKRAKRAERKLKQLQEVLPMLGEVNAKLTAIAANDDSLKS